MQSDAGVSITHCVMQWIVNRLRNGTYRIQNVDQRSYADTEHRDSVEEGHSVVGTDEREYAQLWKITETEIGNY